MSYPYLLFSLGTTSINFRVGLRVIKVVLFEDNVELVFAQYFNGIGSFTANGVRRLFVRRKEKNQCFSLL
jgi:hypothetical protein